MEKIWGNQKIRTGLLLFLVLMAAVSLLQGIRNAAEFSQDFQWDAAKAFTLHINPYEESLAPTGALDPYGYEEYFKQMEANQFPSLLMLLIPYTFLPPLPARYCWLCSNLLFTVGILWLLKKTFLKTVPKEVFCLVSLLMIAGTPYRNQLGVGQHTLFSFFFFLLAVFCSEKEKGQIGMILSLCVCYFKYTLTVPLVLYFVYKRKWKELATSALVHIVLTGFSAIWLGTRFLDMLIEPLRVSSALAAEGGLDFGALFHGSPVAFLLAFIVMAMLFTVCLKLPAGHDSLLVSVLTAWALIVTYHRTYDFFVLIIVVSVFYEVTTVYGKISKASLAWQYATVLVGVFFVLRLFSESPDSKIVVGTVYYVFTFVLTYLLFAQLQVGKGKENE